MRAAGRPVRATSFSTKRAVFPEIEEY